MGCVLLLKTKEKGARVGEGGGCGLGTGKGTGKSMCMHLSKLPFSDLAFSSSLMVETFSLATSDLP